MIDRRWIIATAMAVGLATLSFVAVRLGWAEDTAAFLQVVIPAGIAAIVLALFLHERRVVAQLRRLSAEIEQQARMTDAVLAASPDHIFMVDRNGKYLYVSPAAARRLERERDEILGKTGRDLGFPEEVIAQTTAHRSKVFASGEPLTHEIAFPGRDGTRHMDYTLSPMQLQDGTTGAVLVTARDVTDRKRAAVALQESEARYRQLVELSPDAIAVHCEGKIVFVNSAAVKLVGARRPEDLIGKPILEMIHPDYRALALERIRRMVGSSRVDLQACKLEYSIVSPK